MMLGCRVNLWKKEHVRDNVQFVPNLSISWIKKNEIWSFDGIAGSNRRILKLKKVKPEDILGKRINLSKLGSIVILS